MATVACRAAGAAAAAGSVQRHQQEAIKECTAERCNKTRGHVVLVYRPLVSIYMAARSCATLIQAPGAPLSGQPISSLVATELPCACVGSELACGLSLRLAARAALLLATPNLCLLHLHTALAQLCCACMVMGQEPSEVSGRPQVMLRASTANRGCTRPAVPGTAAGVVHQKPLTNKKANTGGRARVYLWQSVSAFLTRWYL